MERKQVLSQLVQEDSKIAVSRYVEAKSRALYRAADEKKLEGVVAKRKESIYLMGRRTKDWIKFKRMADAEFIVAGYIQKGLHTFSLVLAKYQRGDWDAVWVDADRVCVVEYMPNTQNALRQPVFKGYRDDVRFVDVHKR